MTINIHSTEHIAQILQALSATPTQEGPYCKGWYDALRAVGLAFGIEPERLAQFAGLLWGGAKGTLT